MKLNWRVVVFWVLAHVLVSETYAQVVLQITTSRGSVVADGTSLGAFTGLSTSYAFQGFTWYGDATDEWVLSYLATPGLLATATTLTFDSTNEIPLSASIYVPSQAFTSSSGESGPITFDATIETSSLTLTPVTDGTRFSGVITGTVASGGTFQINVAGILSSLDYSVTLSSVVRLYNVDSELFAGSNITITTRSTGTYLSSVPEPATYATMALGLGCIGLVACLRRRGKTKQR